MKPKDRRERLFGKDRPLIRELDLLSPNGYGKDMAILWGAYKTGSFPLEEDMSQQEFAETIKSLLKGYNIGWMIEDRTAKFSNGTGSIALVLGVEDGFEVEPEFYFFSWASTRNKLRVVVQFLHMMRYSKDFGVITIKALDEDKKFMNRIERYGVLKFLATMPKGDPTGNKHIYYSHGRK